MNRRPWSTEPIRLELTAAGRAALERPPGPPTGRRRYRDTGELIAGTYVLTDRGRAALDRDQGASAKKGVR